MAWISAVSAPELGVAWVTATTSGTPLTASESLLTVPFGSVLAMTSAAMERGAL